MADNQKAGDLDKALYRDPSAPVEKRVLDLLSRMSLDEKISQLKGVLFPWGEENFPARLDTDGTLIKTEKYRAAAQHGLGAVAQVHHSLSPERSVAYVAALQKDMLEETRLGIPLLVQGECCHGQLAQGATVFPLPPALAATFDDDLVRRVFSAVGRETRSRGGTQGFSPCLDIGRDPRWGRMEETFGEDPFLVSRMGVAAVQGLQGGDSLNPTHIAATVKHFAGYGQSEGGRQGAPADIPPRMLQDEILAPFESAVREGRACGVMPSYSEIDGVPCHANAFLLTSQLREQWGFTGVVTSDFGALAQLVTEHGVAGDTTDAARQALLAGVDMDLPNGNVFESLRANAVDHPDLMKRIDRSVSHVLRLKFELGLFERPVPGEDDAVSTVHCEGHQALALESARKSIILLKNAEGLLPLDRAKLSRIAVIGPHSRYLDFGGVSPHNEGVSILDGITASAGGDVDVVWAQGCALTDRDEPLDHIPAPAEDTPPKQVAAEQEERVIAEAAEAARGADVAVLCLGESSEVCGENYRPGKRGDRAEPALVGQQSELLEAVAATGTPVVVVLIHGRTLVIDRVVQRAGAVLDCWNLGEARGAAVAEALFGEYNPAGRLPVTVPRSAGQLPCHYYRREKGMKPGYALQLPGPQFPFGYGLSYTTFEYRNLKLSTVRLLMKRAVEVTVDVQNTGDRAGEEVVQLYVHDKVASVTRPVKELRGFRRIMLEPGESKTVAFMLTAHDLEFTGVDMTRRAEPGEFDIFVGPNSVEGESTTVTLVEG